MNFDEEKLTNGKINLNNQLAGKDFIDNNIRFDYYLLSCYCHDLQTAVFR